MKKLTYLAIVLVLSFELTLGSIKYETVSLYAQSNALVSIVNGASSPSISKPYDPSPLAIKAGTSVTWTNNDSTVHTVTSGLPEQGEVGTLFDSSIISPGKTFTHAFDKTGTFDYSCTLHPFMRGQIIAK
ncbi:MAG TPA: plastocyanin/azurin family copper-binding protein [Nitrososphaeraceae archaeon]|nr:plastocyanin/azurin family copper-binding protein [Nitrososphaeraceae archaeon]